MSGLAETIGTLQEKLPGLRQRGLNEEDTKRILIEPVLQALGWDLRDPEQVSEQYAVTGGQRVDYALGTVHGKPLLLIEAKPIGDPLRDDKATAQAVAYAAQAGVASYALTNGVLWRVYDVVAGVAPEDQLLFEVDLGAPGDGPDATRQAADRLALMGRESVTAGGLREQGHRLRDDRLVHAALEAVLSEPAPQLMSILVKRLGAKAPTKSRVRASVRRWVAWSGAQVPGAAEPEPGEPRPGAAHRDRAGPNAQALYRRVVDMCLELRPGSVEHVQRRWYDGFRYRGQLFATVAVRRSALRAYVRLSLDEVPSPNDQVRDVSKISHVGVGDVEVKIGREDDLPEFERLARMALEKVESRTV